MKYYGYFRNTDTSVDNDGQLFKVVIITNFLNNETAIGGELTLSSSPFIVEYEGEDSQIHKPYKCSTATVSFYQEDVNYEFSDSTGNNVLVKLLKYKNEGKIEDEDNYNCEWVGFATPNAYSQSYERKFDLFEMECQDALSTLQYWKYEPVFNNEKRFASFSDIIKKWVKFLGVYNNIYITDAIEVPTEDFQDILHTCFIDERNFYDEDDEPMKMLEVLENICNYLTLTCIPWGDSLYFVNYDAIKNGHNDYYKIYKEVDDDFYLDPHKYEFKDFHEIIAEDFASTGTSLSIDTVFNKAVVSDNMYAYNTIIPDLEETDKWVESDYHDTVGQYDSYNIIRQSDDYITVIDNIRNGKQKVFLKFRHYNDSPTEDLYYSGIRTDWYNMDIDEGNGHYFPDYTPITSQINDQHRWDYNTIRNYIGATYVQYGVKEVDDFNEPINDVELKDAILIAQPTLYQGYSGEWGKDWYLPYINGGQPIITWNTQNVAVGGDNYIVISGKFKMFGNEDCLPTKERGDWKQQGELAFVWCSLRCGGYWWDGTEWKEPTHVEVKFKLPLKYEKDKEAMNTDIPIGNNVDWTMKLDCEGYAIPIPNIVNAGDVHIGNIEFIMYRPFLLSQDYARLTLLKDFNIQIATESDANIIGVEDDDDAEYTNVMNGRAVEEYEGVDLKITTWDKKSTNHSSVLYYENFEEDGFELTKWRNPWHANFRRLQTIYNSATGEILRPEEQIVSMIVRQYSTPTTNLELNLHYSIDAKPYTLFNYHFFEGKDFVVDTMNIDYGNNTNTLKIVEKK